MKQVLTVFAIVALLLLAIVAAAADQNVVMEITGMTCEACTVAVKKALTGVQGVKSVKVSFDEKRAWLVADESVTEGMLNDALKKAGDYEGKVLERKK